LFLGSKRHRLKDWTTLLGHVRRREVTKGGVLRSWQELVVGHLERLRTSSAKNVLEMIL